MRGQGVVPNVMKEPFRVSGKTEGYVASQTDAPKDYRMQQKDLNAGDHGASCAYSNKDITVTVLPRGPETHNIGNG